MAVLPGTGRNVAADGWEWGNEKRTHCGLQWGFVWGDVTQAASECRVTVHRRPGEGRDPATCRAPKTLDPGLPRSSKPGTSMCPLRVRRGDGVWFEVWFGLEECEF
ncbi:hypothetical protein GCM10010872_02780 [Dyella flava]|nr:hypothetical protein GCM10010872_02780 [Dyella flava]